jgi:uncharacterized membrane protein
MAPEAADEHEEPGLFETFMDLPLHVLVLHFAVVLLPLSALVTVAVFLRRAWREDYGGPVAALNVAMLALTFVTYKAGEALKSNLNPTDSPKGVPTHHHEGYGTTLLWIMVALAVVAVVTWAVGRRPGMMPAAVTGLSVIVAGLAVASATLTVITGHTGSQSHWGYLYAKHSD